ncbi:unnamed protein product, partial [Brassica rapa subsp. trilocularis]
LRLNINSPSQRTNHKFDFFPSECQRLCLTNQSIPLSLTSLPKSLNLQDSLCSCQQNVSRSIHHFVIIPQEERETYPRLKQLPLRHQFLTTLSCLLPRTSPLTTLIKNQVLCSYTKQCWIIYINKFVSLITLLLYVLDEAALIMIRHGEFLWNAKNLFTGCVDVPLTEKGVEEAIEAGKRISNIPIDVIFTSSLIRAQMTAMLAMIQHRRKKVPIILHNESDQAKSWSQVFSEETKDQSVPVIPAWQLNERMYGELQGLNKQETAERYGKQQVHEWRRSYDIPPPKGESLEMCAERAVAYFEENIEPKLAAGKNVMIAAHGNSLRSIIMYLDKLTCKEVISLELSTGIPLLYIFKDGKFMKRGSPVGPTEAGVYAYTKVRHRFYCSTIFVFFEFSVLDGSLCLQRLAQYRQKLDESSEVICS